MNNVLEWSGILLLCIVCVGFISTLIIVVTGKRSSSDRFAKVLKGLVIGSIAFVFLYSFLTTRIYLHCFYSNLESRPSMALNYAGSTTTVKSSEEIQAFINVLKGSKRISPHHSHPVNEIQLTLPEDDNIYKLGKDSSVTDEYWLNIQNGHVGSTMLQFKSIALKEWLRRNGIKY